MAEHRGGGLSRIAFVVVILVMTLGTGATVWLADLASSWPGLRVLPQPQPARFEDLAEQVKPMVVSVQARIERNTGEDDAIGQGRSGRFGAPNGGPENARPRFGTSQGSGFFISADGYAVTTNHLVERAHDIAITTDDGARTILQDRSAPIQRRILPYSRSRAAAASRLPACPKGGRE